jgi:DNA-binding MarR family transcriptional regulator
VLEELSEEETAAYRELARVVFAFPRAVSADIEPACRLGLSYYMALGLLSQASGRRLRMTEIAAACGLSLSAISRIMDRLDREGLTRRGRTPEDGRGTVAMLTEAGQAALERGSALHVASIRRHVFKQLGDTGLANFTSAMKSIADSLLVGGAARSDRGPGRGRRG